MCVKNRLDRTRNSFQIWNLHVYFQNWGNLSTFEYKYKVIFSSMYIFLALRPIVLGVLGHCVMRIPPSLSTKHHAEGLCSSQGSSALAYFSLWFTHWPNFSLVVMGRWLIGPRKSINVCNLQEDSGSDPPLGRPSLCGGSSVTVREPRSGHSKKPLLKKQMYLPLRGRWWVSDGRGQDGY